MSSFKIVQIDNYDRDNDTEVEVTGIPSGNYDQMRCIAQQINMIFVGDRFWKVVPSDYVCKVFEGY